MVLDRRYHVAFTRKVNRCTYFKDEEGSVIARSLIAGLYIDWATVEHVQLADAIRALLTTDPRELFFGIIEPTYLELTMELCSTFHLQTLSVPEYSAALGLYTEEFKEENELHALTRHIHFSSSKCWHTLAPSAASYNPSHSKASVLPPYLRKGVISIGPYVTWLARHFELLSTVTQESSLTLIGQMSPQGISSMLSMRMIERHRGTYPPQYRLTQSTEEEAYEDIPDDVPPQHKDPPTQPPPPSRLVHAATSYADISKHLTRFEQQCFQ
ncbi:hypothetical protein GOBAR_AA28183 [Gossypium barbadense]|uniref:Uncharacterized protein n=1 Tax=Gossypium barbadense TaxID=3634 RepID=A0A2P5WN18_GOSBA|nr:hypothetical protein GOBAR_AA28183 [Gossypium barbadense]